MSDPAIRTFGLTKAYDSVLALEDVDLRVERGDVYALLGRNGAGKTTAIRLLLGMLSPTAGGAELLGRAAHPGSPELWRRIGYLVEGATAYPELTVRENLEAARRLQDGTDPAAVDREIDRLALGRYAERRARTLSSGNLQRLALARALVHDPELVLLDEPTVGLDPAGMAEIRTLLRTLSAERGTTVFLSSHILGEVERLATRVGVVHDGRLIMEVDAEDLTRCRGRWLEVEARNPEVAERALREAGYDPVREGSSFVRFQLHEARAIEAPDQVAQALVQAGAPPTRLATARQDIESFFLDLTSDAR